MFFRETCVVMQSESRLVKVSCLFCCLLTACYGSCVFPPFSCWRVDGSSLKLFVLQSLEISSSLWVFLLICHDKEKPAGFWVFFTPNWKQLILLQAPMKRKKKSQFWLKSLFKALRRPLSILPKAVKNKVSVWTWKEDPEGDSLRFSDVLHSSLSMHQKPAVRFPCWGQETGNRLKKNKQSACWNLISMEMSLSDLWNVNFKKQKQARKSREMMRIQQINTKKHKKMLIYEQVLSFFLKSYSSELELRSAHDLLFSANLFNKAEILLHLQKRSMPSFSAFCKELNGS